MADPQQTSTAPAQSWDEQQQAITQREHAAEQAATRAAQTANQAATQRPATDGQKSTWGNVQYTGYPASRTPRKGQ